MSVIVFVSVFVLFFLMTLFLIIRLPQLQVPNNISTDEKLNILNKWLEDVHGRKKFNGSVLLSKKGKVIFSNSYGYNDAGNNTLLTEHSSFNLASVSKQFTAMGIVLLHHHSKLKYNDKLSQYIPELSFYSDITIEHLLHHTSGLSDYMRLAAKNKNGSDVFTIDAMISIYKENCPKLSFKSGDKFQYSNTGYVLLAAIIERVSGDSFQEFLDTHIFKPLNMNDSQVFNLLSKSSPLKRVYGFKQKPFFLGNKKVVVDLNYLDGVAGDGGVYSSIHNMNLWHEALRDGILVPKKSYEVAYQPTQLNDGSKIDYGFGWLINANDSVKHSGGWQGFTSYIYRNLINDELIVILDNSSNILRATDNGFRFNSIGLNLKYFMERL